MSKHEYSKDNQPEERKPRGKGKRTLMLDAIRDVCKDEHEFLREIVKIGMGGLTVIGTDDDGNEEKEYKPPNTMLLNLVLNRIEPPLKATSPMVNFEFDKSLKPHQQAAQVLNAVSNGEVAPDIGNIFVQSIRAMIDIEEYTDLKSRIEAIEESLGLSSD